MHQVSGAIEDIIHAIQKTPQDNQQESSDTREPGHFTNRIQKVQNSFTCQKTGWDTNYYY